MTEFPAPAVPERKKDSTDHGSAILLALVVLIGLLFAWLVVVNTYERALVAELKVKMLNQAPPEGWQAAVQGAVLPWRLGGVLVSLLAGGGVYLWKMRQARQRREARSHALQMQADLARTSQVLDELETLRRELDWQVRQRTADLSQAYDLTLEGWARAIDLRDHETGEHSARLARLTVILARSLKFSEEELVHIRRGAILHDVGKMGVPDNILMKSGPLMDDEWLVMRQHPVIANEMLSRISFLAPALDIPYCHHEKWDGSGYPRGLSGEQIPLAARIFAVVDVWDSLTSDRPYRKAWTPERALGYIKEQAGKHFDPAVVEQFLKIVDIQEQAE
ncbi:MAG TPA: HD domain-containing phosphohydrolase [Anaerolineaceae bacterium]